MKLIKKVIFILPIFLILILLLIKFQFINFHKFDNFIFNDLNIQNLSKPQKLTSDSKYKKISSIDSIIPNNYSWYYLDPTQYELNEILNLENDGSNYRDNLIRGRILYQTHCQFCHDSSGSGNGLIVTKVTLDSLEEGFPKPQDITRDITKTFSNSRLYHILSTGQNLMFSVSHKLNNEERKDLMNYIHFLQNKSSIK